MSLGNEESADSFVFAINGTNMLTAKTGFMPQSTTVTSGTIDVTAWKGRSVEMFFGIVGRTFTNASITVKHLNTLGSPVLNVAKDSSGVRLSWSIMATS